MYSLEQRSKPSATMVPSPDPGLQFMTQSFKTMQEYQSAQFEYMLKKHSEIMSKLIDKIPHRR